MLKHTSLYFSLSAITLSAWPVMAATDLDPAPSATVAVGSAELRLFIASVRGAPLVISADDHNRPSDSLSSIASCASPFSLSLSSTHP